MAARDPTKAVTDAAANPEAMSSPTGVAMTKPAFEPSRRTPGVARA